MPMSKFGAAGKKRAFFNPYYLSIGLAIVIVILIGGFIERQSKFSHEQTLRVKISHKLHKVASVIEGNINDNIRLVRELVSAIAVDPEITQARFGEIASRIMSNKSQLRNIAGAPDLVISLMYPMKGNEKAMGLDYNKNEKQRKAVIFARESRKTTLAGPVDLVQGGRGFIVRFPVFINPSTKKERFWGVVSAVIDVDRLYQASGLLSPDLPIQIAINGIDGTGETGGLIFGTDEIVKSDPILADVHLPSGSWRLLAMPLKGWSHTPTSIWMIRSLIFAIGVFFILPIFVSGRLHDMRRSQSAELKSSQDKLDVVSKRLKLALDTSKIGIWEMNTTTGELIWDNRMKELYGLAPDEDVDKIEVWKNALHPDDLRRAEQEFQDAIAAGGGYRSDFRVRTPENTYRNIRTIGTVYENDDGSQYIVGVNWDVSADVEMQEHLFAAKRSAESRNTELEQARAQMERNSLHDSLTGLPNRRYLDNVLSVSHNGNQRAEALLHVDLDRFKQINDTLGHAAGDAMLIHAAEILKTNIRKGDFLARTGGDEFVIVLTSPIEEGELKHLATRVLTHMGRPVPYEGHECRFGASAGIAYANENANARKRLLINADIALYRAKESGRNRYEVFTKDLEAEVVCNKRIADDILSGLDRQEFLPYYQPQFNAKTLDVVGVEALVRWDHPTDGLLPPDAFLGIAADLNVVPIIDRLVLEQALWQATRWKANGLDIPKVSVNVSAGRLSESGLIESLSGLAITPGALSFELLESIFLDDTDKTVAANIKRLKKMGIDIEIDDFGTGYASIVSLLQLSPRRLKIDRCLVQPILKSKKQRQLVASIIDIGHSLGIEVTAEGVETMEHAKILNKMDCDTLQGYAFAKPLSAADLMAFVSENRWRKAG